MMLLHLAIRSDIFGGVVLNSTSVIVDSGVKPTVSNSEIKSVMLQIYKAEGGRAGSSIL